MAERRAVTAREIKSSVEGYQEMSDEAFARRFYSDRAELQALGVPLTSQRDVYTGEELYNMRSERYFLPELELHGEELAALQTELDMLEGKLSVNPHSLLQDAGAWYDVGHDLDADDERTFRVSRIRGEIRFATRRERDFRPPAELDVDQYRGRPPWQIGNLTGEARIEVG